MLVDAGDLGVGIEDRQDLGFQCLELGRRGQCGFGFGIALAHPAQLLVAADILQWTPSEPFDAVLLDAPCTATGTIRRHPDVARLKRPGDVASLATSAFTAAFKIGIQLSAPFLVFGIVFNIGLGVLARLMPQMQVYFVGVPLSILFGFLILAPCRTSDPAYFRSVENDT